MMVSVAGSAPERSSSACSWVCWVVKVPVMMPLPPQIALCTTGALMTSLSSWMASRLPMLARVAAQKARPPAALKVKLMIGRPPCCCLERGLGVVEILAAHDHALEHRQALRLEAPADLLRGEPRDWPP